MRVALVADTLSVIDGTGIARYASELRAGLMEQGVEVHAIAPSPPGIPLGLALNHALRMPYLVARQAEAFDVVHATSPITALAFPMIRKPKVVTYHDLVSLNGKATGTAVHARVAAPLFLRVGRYADRIIANSSTTREEIITRLGLPADKVSVVSWGVSEIFTASPRTKRGKPVIGYVGALNRRKGLPYLIKAFHILRSRHPMIEAKLVLCGAPTQEYRRLLRVTAALGLSEHVEFRGSVTDDELVDAYNSFDVLILPSEHEGFGLPILEAQRCGVPVIIREDANIPQEVSKCCLKASSEEDMAERIFDLLTPADLRQETITQGLEHSRQFTWANAARWTIALYEAVLARN